MEKFSDYARRRFMEDVGLSIDELRSMIVKALGGNPESKDAYNSPLVQFAEPGALMDKLNTLQGLASLIQNNAAAQEALQKAQQTNLTVGELVGILLTTQQQ